MPGLLSDEQQQQQRNMGLLNMGLALMQPYNRMQGLGGHIGNALAAGNQAMQQYPQQAMEQQQFQMQIEEHRRKQAEAERMSQGRAGFRDNLPESERRLYDADPGLYMKNRAYKDPKFAYHNGQIIREDQIGSNGAPSIVGSLPVQTPFGFNPDGSMIPGYEASKMRVASASAPRNNVNVNTGQKGFDNERSLHKDLAAEPIYKAHQDVKRAYAQIEGSLNKESPAGDMAAATMMMKLLDPGSVVRESELAMALSARGMLDSLTNYAGMVISGQKMTPRQREDFRALSAGLFAESERLYSEKASEYRNIAGAYGLSGDRVAPLPKARAQNPSTQPVAIDRSAIEREIARRRGVK